MKRCAILGGGISGLAASFYLSRMAPELSIDLYEARSRLGGVIRTEVIEACIIEGGPDSFLTQKGAAKELCLEAGMDSSSFVYSNDAMRSTSVLDQGELKKLPEGMFLMAPLNVTAFLFNPLISWPGKLAAASDFFAFPEREDLTVADFIEMHFGTEILDKIAEPMLAGVYGADIRRLSLKNALPMLWEMQKKGSIVRAARKMKGHSSKPAPLFTTLDGGMETIIHRLRDSSERVNWRLDFAIDRIEREGNSWRVGDSLYDIILIATGSVPQIATTAGERIADLIGSIRKNSAVVIALVFEKTRRTGFGWLVPRDERKSVLACTYVSNKFPGRSPENLFVVRLFIGSEQAIDWLSRSDSEIYEEARSELRRIAQIGEEPRFWRVFRWKDAMPEYSIGHDRIVNEIEGYVAQEKTLFLTGNLYGGIGLSDCIQHAKQRAEKIALLINRA